MTMGSMPYTRTPRSGVLDDDVAQDVRVVLARVARVLSSHNAVDIDKRAAEWESTGWTRKNPVPASYSSSADVRARGTDRAVTPDNTGNMGTTSGTGGMDPSTSDIGSSHRRSTTSRIYNP